MQHTAAILLIFLITSDTAQFCCIALQTWQVVVLLHQQHYLGSYLPRKSTYKGNEKGIGKLWLSIFNNKTIRGEVLSWLPWKAYSTDDEVQVQQQFQ